MPLFVVSSEAGYVFREMVLVAKRKRTVPWREALDDIFFEDAASR